MYTCLFEKVLYMCVAYTCGNKQSIFMVQDTIREKQMVRVASDGGTGRRLPQWMVGVRADDQVQISNDVDNNRKSLEEEELDSQACLAKEANSIRHPQKSMLPQQKEILMEDPCITDCESKKRKGRKRKSSQHDEAEEADDPKTVPAKKSNRLRRKLMDSAKKSKRPNDLGSSSNLDIRAQPPGDDDMELTVEDLMVIAKEVVYPLLHV